MVQRMAWLDWQRGLAVFFMIEVHVLSGWTAPEAATGFWHAALRWLGGLAAPGFLYMAGLAQVLADQAQARKGVGARARRRGAIKRGLYVLGVAYTFRLAEYLLGFTFWVPGGWQGIFKVDILNIIGVSLVLAGVLGVGRGLRTRVVGSAGAILLVVAVTPWVAELPTSAPWAGYLYMPDTSGFGLCNWAAFLFAGSLVGSLLGRGLKAPHLLMAGAALVAGGLGALALLPPYPDVVLWAASPPWFAVRLGETVGLSGLLMLLPQASRGVTVQGGPPGASRFSAKFDAWGRVSASPLTPTLSTGGAGCFASTPSYDIPHGYPPERLRRGFAGLSLFGRHSLAAYMLSVELTYGLLLKRLHGRLELGLAFLGIAAMTLAVWALVWLWERLAAVRQAPAPALPQGAPRAPG